jgi:photosystem II protein
VSTVVVANAPKKVDVKKQGMNSVSNDIVRNNLMGNSRVMKDKNWVDPQGRKGKVRNSRHLPLPGHRALSSCGFSVEPAGARGTATRAAHALLPPHPLPPDLPPQGYGVYKFADKYGVNVDGYSPIYTPDTWSEGGAEYKLGAKGLIAWAGLLVVLLGVGISLVVSTSAIGQ